MVKLFSMQHKTSGTFIVLMITIVYDIVNIHRRMCLVKKMTY